MRYRSRTEIVDAILKAVDEQTGSTKRITIQVSFIMEAPRTLVHNQFKNL
jgi:predicted transcriptional regulator